MNIPGSAMNIPGSAMNIPGSAMNIPSSAMNIPGFVVTEEWHPTFLGKVWARQEAALKILKPKEEVKEEVEPKVEIKETGKPEKIYEEIVIPKTQTFNSWKDGAAKLIPQYSRSDLVVLMWLTDHKIEHFTVGGRSEILLRLEKINRRRAQQGLGTLESALAP